MRNDVFWIESAFNDQPLSDVAVNQLDVRLALSLVRIDEVGERGLESDELVRHNGAISSAS